MTLMPNNLKLTAAEQKQLDAIQTKAKVNHAKAARAARRRGENYPDFPVECSWAYEESFRRAVRGEVRQPHDFDVVLVK